MLALILATNVKINPAVSKLGGADNYQTKVWWQRRDK